MTSEWCGLHATVVNGSAVVRGAPLRPIGTISAWWRPCAARAGTRPVIGSAVPWLRSITMCGSVPNRSKPTAIRARVAAAYGLNFLKLGRPSPTLWPVRLQSMMSPTGRVSGVSSRWPHARWGQWKVYSTPHLPMRRAFGSFHTWLANTGPHSGQIASGRTRTSGMGRPLRVKTM